MNQITHRGNCSGNEFIAMRNFAMGWAQMQKEFQNGAAQIDQSLSVARLGRLVLARGAGTTVHGLIKFRFVLLLVLESDDSELTDDQIAATHLWVCPIVDMESVALHFLEIRDASGLGDSDWLALRKKVG